MVARVAAQEAWSIRVNIEDHSSGFHIATSPDMPGLFVVDKDLEKVEADIPLVLEAIYRLQHKIDVVVVKAPFGESKDRLPDPWVVMAANCPARAHA